MDRMLTIRGYEWVVIKLCKMARSNNINVPLNYMALMRLIYDLDKIADERVKKAILRLCRKGIIKRTEKAYYLYVAEGANA